MDPIDKIGESEEVFSDKKNFDKVLCFTNIRELLRKNPDVKIGQIEKEAGFRLGYMARLEREGNTAEPSIEFIVTAAKLLKVSVDTLIGVDLTGLTSTEQYIVNFFEKLKADTVADKLDWQRESELYLNRIDCDHNGIKGHPLFSVETFIDGDDCDSAEEITKTVFSSKSYGPPTRIAGDCFNLRLKNGTILYLMDVEKYSHRTVDKSAYAKEAWMYVPGHGSSPLVSSRDKTPVAPMVESLFATVKESMERPRINQNIMEAIDSFMKDDLTDDSTEYLPF